nr:hypothetical protein [Streptomyces sp. TRM70350]
MAGFGQGTRGYPRSRGRTWSRTGPDRAQLGTIGAIRAIAGFRPGHHPRPMALTALTLIRLTGASSPGYGSF